MEALDGNAIAGSMFVAFGHEMTTVTGRCTICRATSVLAELRVYMRAPGAVVRCPACGNVVMVIVEARGSSRAHLPALELLEQTGESGGLRRT